MIARLFVLAALFIALQTNAANPMTLRLSSGELVPVLSIRKTTLHETNEVALVLTYQTKKNFADQKAVALEIEQVWAVFKNIAEQEGVSAAVVVASEPPRSFAIVKSGGNVWKKGADGQWRPPGKNDRGLVPRGQHS